MWVEHNSKVERIFESQAEKDHKAAHEAERIIKFAEANVPGYSVARG